jgi:hypothetical protein
VKVCTKQIAKYTDRLFLFIFIFHILAKLSFAPNKTPNIPTDYSFLFFIFHILAKVRTKKTQRPLGLEG